MIFRSQKSRNKDLNKLSYCTNLPFWIFSGDATALTLPDADWCRGDYNELLSGRYLNGRTSEILCHNRETGLHMSYFAYACKTEGKNGISRLISALCVNCLISIPEYSRIIDYSSECASGVDYFRNLQN